MIKKILLFFFSFFIGITLFVWIIDFVGWEEIKNSFLVFTVWQGVIIFVLTLLIMMVGNWKWKEILKGEKVEISFWHLFKSYLAGFAVMFLAPILLALGDIIRIYNLRRENHTPWLKTTASVIIDRVLEWTVNLIIVFFGILILLYKIGFPSKNLIIFGGLFLVFVIWISLFYFKTLKRKSTVKIFGRFFNGRLNKELFGIEKEIFNFFRFKNKSMWKSLGLSFLRGAIMYLRTWFLIIFLGKQISALSSLPILGFTYLSAMIPIPTALGSHEAIQTFAFKSLGLGISSATAFTMIIRATEFLFALVGIILLAQIGVIFLQDIIFKGIEKFNKLRNSL